MGCGHSKINLYPRRNKTAGKANGRKKAGGSQDDEEEEGSGGAGAGGAGGAVGAGAAGAEEALESRTKPCPVPLTQHPPPLETSASQQDFFKMLDQKIDNGRDYDSSSESEINRERERKSRLVEQWKSLSISSQSSSPKSIRQRPNGPERTRSQSPTSNRRCMRQPQDSYSPPPRRCQSAQPNSNHEAKHSTDTRSDANKSPVRRPQSAGASWKGNPKVAPYPHKRKGNENPGQEPNDSQITYNPTFQTHSPAHCAKLNLTQQPYITQIITYPMTQQVPHAKEHDPLIAPPEAYQDRQNAEGPKYENARVPVAQVSPQQSVYYIHGNANQNPQDINQQRQQTALHLQQYVAMKQAQQQMYTYFQRMPQAVYPQLDYGRDPNRIYESVEENFATYGHQPRANSAPIGIVRPMPITPGVNPLTDVTPLVHQMTMWTHLTPMVTPLGPWQGPPPQTEVQYYHQAHLINNSYRANSAGSAGTLTRYHKMDADHANASKNVCQTMNIVRQKPIGQIVAATEHVPSESQNTSPNANVSDTIRTPVNGDDTRTVVNAITSQNNVNTVQSATNQVDNRINSRRNRSMPFKARSLKNSKSVDSKD